MNDLFKFKKNVTIDINIKVSKPNQSIDNGWQPDSESSLWENFSIRVDSNMNIVDIRNYIIGAINAIEDYSPDTDENRKHISYSDLPAHISNFSCKLWVI